MNYKPALLALVLVSSTLAGCTGDPDGGGNDEIDSDALQNLFDEHFEDFINNTTITVNNHYHNNTTYVVDDGDYSNTVNNEYNNTTNVDGGEVNNYYEEYDYSQDNYSFGGNGVGGNGSGSAGTLYLLDIQFTLADLMPDWAEIDYRNNTVDYAYEYYDYLTNSQRTDIFTIQCSDYYLIGSQSTNATFEVSYWQDSSNYWNAWDDQYNQTIADMLQTAATSHYSNLTGDSDYHVRQVCDEDYNTDAGVDGLLLFEIPIPAGVALMGILDSNFAGQEEYVWGYENYQSIALENNHYAWIGIGDMLWRGDYYPLDDVEHWYGNRASFDVDYEFETIGWGYGHSGWIGGDEDSVLTVTVNDIFPEYQYRLIAYFTMAPVVPLE